MCAFSENNGKTILFSQKCCIFADIIIKHNPALILIVMTEKDKFYRTISKLLYFLIGFFVIILILSFVIWLYIMDS